MKYIISLITITITYLLVSVAFWLPIQIFRSCGSGDVLSEKRRAEIVSESGNPVLAENVLSLIEVVNRRMSEPLTDSEQELIVDSIVGLPDAEIKFVELSGNVWAIVGEIGDERAFDKTTVAVDTTFVGGNHYVTYAGYDRMLREREDALRMSADSFNQCLDKICQDDRNGKKIIIEKRNYGKGRIQKSDFSPQGRL